MALQAIAGRIKRCNHENANGAICSGTFILICLYIIIFIKDIRILDLSLGTKFPVVNNIRVEKVEMSEDRENFEVFIQMWYISIHFVLRRKFTLSSIWSILVTSRLRLASGF